MTSSNISSRSAAAWPEVSRAALAALMLAAAAAWHAEVVFAIASAALLLSMTRDAKSNASRRHFYHLIAQSAVDAMLRQGESFLVTWGGDDDEDMMALAQHTSKRKEREKGK